VGSRTATLIIRYRAKSGEWIRALPARGGNGRIRPGYALIDDQAEQVDGFVYQIRFYENRRLKYETVGRDAAEAETRRRVIAQQASAKADAIRAGLKVESQPARRNLAETAAAYIADAEGRGANEAAAQARVVSEEFLSMVRKSYIDEITREDFFKFHAALRRRGCQERTVANKHQRLASWLRFAGMDRTVPPPRPRYEQALPTIYNRDEISTLLSEAQPQMRIAILIGLKLGLRDQELIHAEFSDVNWSEKTFRVRGKPRWNFKVKTHEQRDVPAPDDVVKELRQWQKENPGQALILETRNHRPHTKLLRALKVLARKAKLNCGRCDGCKSKRRECKEFTLHKFRRTYITTLLRNGIDLRTVQAYAGHKDIQSTMKYLRPASAKEVQAKLNAVQW
jgi:integrase